MISVLRVSVLAGYEQTQVVPHLIVIQIETATLKLNTLNGRQTEPEPS